MKSSHPNYPTRKRSLEGPPITHKRGGIEHADKLGTDIAVRSAVPLPVAEYDKWLGSGNAWSEFQKSPHRTEKTGYRLRRIVIMRREGATWKDCGEAVGVTGDTAKQWVEFLPMDLAI